MLNKNQHLQFNLFLLKWLKLRKFINIYLNFFSYRIFLLTTALIATVPSTIYAQFHHFGEALNTSPLGADCALILSGPGRSSVYDYSVNLFRGSL